MVGARSASEIVVLKELHKISESFDGVVIVGSAGYEPHVEINAVSSSHGCRSCIEIDGFSLRGDCPIEHGGCQRSSKAETTPAGANPQTLQFPRVCSNLR
jgi:hypothetical protein